MVLVLAAAPVCVTGAGALLACLGVVTTQLSTRLSSRCAPNPGGRALRSVGSPVHSGRDSPLGGWRASGGVRVGGEAPRHVVGRGLRGLTPRGAFP